MPVPKECQIKMKFKKLLPRKKRYFRCRKDLTLPKDINCCYHCPHHMVPVESCNTYTIYM